MGIFKAVAERFSSIWPGEDNEPDEDKPSVHIFEAHNTDRIKLLQTNPDEYFGEPAPKDDALYTERRRLLREDPDEYFRRYPKPRFNP